MIKHRDNSTKYVLLLMLATIFNATNGIWVRLSEIGPIGTAMWRAALALPILYFLGRDGLKGASVKDILVMLGAGVFLGGELVFFNMALVRTSNANCSLLANLTVFTIVPISYFVFKEKIPKKFFLGAAVTLIGVVVLVLGKSVPTQTSYTGDLFALIASVGYGLYIVIGYKLRDKYPSSTIMFVATFTMLAVLVVASAVFEGLAVPTTWRSIWPILGYTLCLQVIGLNLCAHCNGHLSVNLSAIVSLFQPVAAGILAYIVFGEQLSWMEIAGMLIVIVGVYVTKREYKSE